VNRWRISAAADHYAVAGLAHVLHVGHVGFDRRFIFFYQGHAPQRLAAARARDRKVVGQLVGGGENRSHFITRATRWAPVSVATSTIASGLTSTARLSPSARMRRPIRVGIQDLDGHAVADREHVPGLRCTITRQVLGHRCDRCDLDFERKRLAMEIAAITIAAPVMSVFIAIMASPDLRESPPESKVTPLPTSAIWGSSTSDSVVSRVHQATWLRRTFATPSDLPGALRGFAARPTLRRRRVRRPPVASGPDAPAPWAACSRPVSPREISPS